MKTVFFITGTHTGLGKALAEEALKRSDSVVFGYSRNQSINVKNYHHITTDFSDVEKLESFIFPEIDDAQQVVLINNAGIIGEIDKIGKIGNRMITQLFNVNLIAPSILINTFLAQFTKKEVSKIIVNVSSGAGKSPIESWAGYCASKAGLDLLSESIEEELKIGGRDDVRIFSIAPGIVDSPMQDKIRQTPKEKFSLVDNFIQYKNQGDLVSPKDVAKKYFQVIDNPNTYPKCIFSVRDF